MNATASSPPIPVATRTVCYPFLGRTIGGSHLSTLMLASNLPPHYRPLLVVHEPGPLTDFLDSRNVSYQLVPLPHMPGNEARSLTLLGQTAVAAPRLMGFLRKHQVAIVHANDSRMNITWAAVCALMKGTRFVWHQRSRYAPSRVPNAFLRLADLVIGVSAFSIDQIPATLHRRSRVILNPFDADAAPPDRAESRRAMLQDFGLPEDARVLLFMGNFMERKRPQAFVAILESLLGAKNPRPLFGLMFGEPREPWATAVRRKSEEAGLGNRLVLAGFRYPPEPLLAGADVLIAPSINEGFGRTLVESMLVGTPVVASRSGGHIDIIEDGSTGYLVPPDDICGFSSAALRLLNSAEEWRRVAAGAQDHARSAYSLRAHASTVIRSYDELIVTADN